MDDAARQPRQSEVHSASPNVKGAVLPRSDEHGAALDTPSSTNVVERAPDSSSLARHAPALPDAHECGAGQSKGHTLVLARLSDLESDEAGTGAGMQHVVEGQSTTCNASLQVALDPRHKGSSSSGTTLQRRALSGPRSLVVTVPQRLAVQCPDSPLAMRYDGGLDGTHDAQDPAQSGSVLRVVAGQQGRPAVPRSAALDLSTSHTALAHMAVTSTSASADVSGSVLAGSLCSSASSEGYALGAPEAMGSSVSLPAQAHALASMAPAHQNVAPRSSSTLAPAPPVLGNSAPHRSLSEQAPAPTMAVTRSPLSRQSSSSSPVIWLQYAACTLAGKSQGGVPKANQDRFFVQLRLGGLANVHLFGVCDGHGPNGHVAAQRVADMFPPQLARRLLSDDAPALVRLCRVTKQAVHEHGEVTHTLGGATSASRAGAAQSGSRKHSVASPPGSPASGISGSRRKEDTGAHPISSTDFAFFALAFKHAIAEVEAALFSEDGTFDASGTTMVCVLILGQHMLVANVGDSRAILVREEDDASASPTSSSGASERPESLMDGPQSQHGGPASAAEQAQDAALGDGDGDVGSGIRRLSLQPPVHVTLHSPSRLPSALCARLAGAASAHTTGSAQESECGGTLAPGTPHGGWTEEVWSPVPEGMQRSPSGGGGQQRRREVRASFSARGGGSGSGLSVVDVVADTAASTPELRDEAAAAQSHPVSVVQRVGGGVREMLGSWRRTSSGPRQVRIAPLALSTDHKPEDPGERARIERRGGVIMRSSSYTSGGRGVAGPVRVWNTVKGTGATYGLAMSRSIGDRAVTSVGVVCKPSVTYHLLQSHCDRAIVLASDGLWDALSPRRVAQDLACKLPVATAASSTCQTAAQQWRAANTGGARDDITVLVLHCWASVWAQRDA